MTSDDEARDEVSDDVPDTIDLGDVAPASARSWERLIEQLRSRGPTHQRYVFEGEIAHGGMGAIHRVYDRDARRRLALKVMLGPIDDSAKGEAPEVDDASLGRFLEEAQVSSQLDHPGIVPVHEIGVDGGGQVYFTMKLVKGEDLRSVFDRVADPNDQEWNTPRALGVMLRVCEAMAYAHAKGVIHRDLKPGNVMVGKFGEAYVMDWGLAKVLGRPDPHDVRLRADTTESLKTTRGDGAGESTDAPILTMDGTVVGTPAYMPPEQAEGRVEELGAPADVYAVGAMLYHLLSGHMPYVKPGARVSPRTILGLVTHGPPRSLAEVARATPAELVAIVEKAMAREIGDRYPDMTALAHDLRAFLEHRVVLAYETGAWAELKKWVQRNTALAMTAATAVIVVAALGTWSNLTIRTERDVAKANEERAEAERDRVLRLSDKRRLDVLRADADALWPAHPENVAPLKDWLTRAHGLLGNLAAHEAALAEVQAAGTPGPDSGDGDVAVDFGSDEQARWWHDAVRELVVGLHQLRSEDVHAATVTGIAARLAWAETVAAATTTGPEVAAKWSAAREAIREHPMYGGLDLKPQLGLVPLGPDPVSTLWEFGHPQTGDVPVRDPDTGELAIAAETGLVFVLIPGRAYRLGAQRDDPGAPHYDAQADADESPVHVTTLSPFFMSKYEMTQGVWARFTGENPSHYRPGSEVVRTLRHPVEQVSWETGRETLSRLALVLPTEAQWEAACRAGTETPWWTGRDRDSLVGAVNLADQAAKRAGEAWPDIEDWRELDDGFAVHAPVGSYRANAFGLHDMHGNVWEWCRDGYSAPAYGVAPDESDGRRDVPGAVLRVYRGGGFSYRASFARCAARFKDAPEARDRDLGLRPARVCE